MLPLLALIVAAPFAWGWGLSWLDVALTAFFYFATGLGVTVGFHRYFTHRAFTANRGARPTHRRPPLQTEPCPPIERVTRGLDLGAPFLPRVAAQGCKITTTPEGIVLTITTWGLQLLAWAFAALFVAGFTGIVRKT